MKADTSTQTSTFSYLNNDIKQSVTTTHPHNGFELLQSFQTPKHAATRSTNNPLHEFENLNADEILNKCGLADGDKSKSSNCMTCSSSSVSISLSSSNQSFMSSATLNNIHDENTRRFRDIALNSSTYCQLPDSFENIDYEEESLNKKM